LGELQTIKTDVGGMKSDMVEMKSDMVQMKSDIAGLKSDVAELKAEQQVTNRRLDKIEKAVELLPYMQQAVMETNLIVKQLEATSKATTSELRNHSFQIDLLNRRELMLEVEIEKLKNPK
jgi:chromosome segregation ATPase